jgi:glutathione S-transferase
MAATQIFLFQSPVERWSGFIRLVLEEKDLDYDAQTINSLTGEQYEPGYVEDLNEKAALPTLVHKNKVVISWNYIARYLEKICKEPPLIPADAAEQSDMDKWLEVWVPHDLGAMRPGPPPLHAGLLSPCSARRRLPTLWS